MVILIVAALAALAVQQPPTDTATAKDTPGKNKNVVLVRGCVNGSMLNGVEPREYTLEVPQTLRLTGNRAMRKQLKELNGHLIEVSGQLKGVDNYATGALVKDTGKTKVYIGGTERRTDSQSLVQEQDQRRQPPTLDVSTFSDVAAQCLAATPN